LILPLTIRFGFIYGKSSETIDLGFENLKTIPRLTGIGRIGS